MRRFNFRLLLAVSSAALLSLSIAVQGADKPGQADLDMAADLQITERTIKLYRANILEKLQVGSMAELARLAVDLGIDPSAPAPCTKDQ